MAEEPDQPTDASPRRAPAPREWVGVGLLLVFALGLRLWNVLALAANDPFFRSPATDGALYHRWAQEIAAGAWLGEGVFAHGPLMPYFLAGVYALAGPDLLVAKSIQALLGALTCGLVWWLGFRLFDARVGLLAGLATALSDQLVFHSGTLVVANLAVPLSLLAIVCVVETCERPTFARAAIAGMAAGLGALARPNALSFAVAMLVWLPFALRSQAARRRVALTLTYAAGTALLVLPVTLRNLVVGGDFVLVTSTGGMNLYLGNNPETDGTFRVPRFLDRSSADDPLEQVAQFRALAERAEGRALRPSEVSDFWRDRTLEYVVGDPAAWLRLEWRKLLLSVNAFEVWNIRSIVLGREFSPVLRLPLVRFGWLAPLAVLGIALTWRRWRRLMPLYALMGSTLAFLLLFFVLGRYRLPVVPVLALFAAAGGFGIARLVRERRFVSLALATTLLGAATAVAHLPLVSDDLSMAWFNLGNRYKAEGRFEEAAGAYQATLRRHPGYLSAWNNLALVYEALERDADAVGAWGRVLSIAERRGLAGYVERARRRRAALGVEGDAATPSPAPAATGDDPSR